MNHTSTTHWFWISSVRHCNGSCSFSLPCKFLCLYVCIIYRSKCCSWFIKFGFWWVFCVVVFWWVFCLASCYRNRMRERLFGIWRNRDCLNSNTGLECSAIFLPEIHLSMCVAGLEEICYQSCSSKEKKVEVICLFTVISEVQFFVHHWRNF